MLLWSYIKYMTTLINRENGQIKGTVIKKINGGEIKKFKDLGMKKRGNKEVCKEEIKKCKKEKRCTSLLHDCCLIIQHYWTTLTA